MLQPWLPLCSLSCEIIGDEVDRWRHFLLKRCGRSTAIMECVASECRIISYDWGIDFLVQWILRKQGFVAVKVFLFARKRVFDLFIQCPPPLESALYPPLKVVNGDLRNTIWISWPDLLSNLIFIYLYPIMILQCSIEGEVSSNCLSKLEYSRTKF